MTTTENRSRHERRNISFTDPSAGWNVNAAGIIRRHSLIQPITYDLGGLPTIDFGHRYVNRRLVGPGYWGPIPSAGDKADTRRLVDEIVAYQFHGAPPCNYRAARVHHLDRDLENCAVQNLQWEVDEEFTAYMTRLQSVIHMVTSLVPAKRKTISKVKVGKQSSPPQLWWVNGGEVSLFTPTEPLEVTECPAA